MTDKERTTRLLEDLQDRACRNEALKKLYEISTLIAFTDWLRSLYPEYYGPLADHKPSEGTMNEHIPMVEWISVNDRLPEGDNYYLTARESGVWVHLFNGGSFANPEVTHWMAMPDAPPGGEVK